MWSQWMQHKTQFMGLVLSGLIALNPTINRSVRHILKALLFYSSVHSVLAVILTQQKSVNTLSELHWLTDIPQRTWMCSAKWPQSYKQFLKKKWRIACFFKLDQSSFLVWICRKKKHLSEVTSVSTASSLIGLCKNMQHSTCSCRYIHNTWLHNKPAVWYSAQSQWWRWAALCFGSIYHVWIPILWYENIKIQT